MSKAIYIRVELEKEFYNTDTSTFLFNIIKEGCNRRIAITVMDEDIMPHKVNEGILSLSDSFNFRFAESLIGKDYDSYVEEYRPEPLQTRLRNLQGLFKLILNEDIVKSIEVFFTFDYDIEELESVDISIDDFAREFEPMIINNRSIELYHRFIWRKQSPKQ